MSPLNLASLTWYNVFKVRAHSSLCQSFIPFYWHLGPWKRRPIEQPQMQPRVWSRLGAAIALATATLRLFVARENLAKALRHRLTVRGYTEEPLKYLALWHCSLTREWDLWPLLESGWASDYLDQLSTAEVTLGQFEAWPLRRLMSLFCPLEALEWLVRSLTSLKLLCL